MNIIIIGAPGSGKGTQAQKLAEKFGLYLLQTGNLARELSKKDARIKKIVNSGKLIPEEEMTMHVIDFLSRKKTDLSDIIFEGFPRFVSQYEALENFLKTKGDDIDAAISLDISDETVIKRTLSRTTKDKDGKLVRRKDDNLESIKVRLGEYHKNTEALINYLDRTQKLTRIDGEQSVEEIFSEVSKIIENLKNG